MDRIIETKYFGATNYRGARIKAICNDVGVSIPYPYEESVENSHRIAADALIEKMGWPLKFVGGGTTKKGYSFLYRG